VNTLPFVYGKGHLPFCTGVVPYNRINSTTTDPIGEGTLYPLTLSPEVFATVFWRVRAWKFSGTFAFLSTRNGTTYEGTTTFEKTLYRTATEVTLACSANTATQSPFTTELEDNIIFGGTATTNDESESVDVQLSVKMAVRAGLSNIRMAMLQTSTNQLQCYLAAQLFATVSPSTVADASTEELPLTDAVGEMTLFLPGDQSQGIPLTMFGDSATLTDVKIEPAEYYEWGGTYDSETGNLL
jgi:hypothetical protein